MRKLGDQVWIWHNWLGRTKTRFWEQSIWFFFFFKSYFISCNCI